MPTRKQRRKRQKDLRHQYEFVYVDESGRELEVEPESVDTRSSRRNGKREPKREAQKSRNARSVKPASPPSWQRVGKRALLFAPLIFVAFSVINSHQALIGRVAVTAVYTAFFVPFMYLMDRAMYRSYLRRTGQPMPPSALRRKR
jgi:hypothetical protein